MEYKRGDLVVSFLSSSGVDVSLSELEIGPSLLGWGLVVDVNPTLKDIRVLDNRGNTQWWSSRTWKIISKA